MGTTKDSKHLGLHHPQIQNCLGLDGVCQHWSELGERSSLVGTEQAFTGWGDFQVSCKCAQAGRKDTK